MDRDGYMNIKELCGIFKVEPKEGDYEKDGLIYCGKCNMPRQRYDDMPGGITDKLPAECLCEKAEREKRTAEEARVRHMALFIIHIIPFDVAKRIPALRYVRPFLWVPV